MTYSSVGIGWASPWRRQDEDSMVPSLCARLSGKEDLVNRRDLLRRDLGTPIVGE